MKIGIDVRKITDYGIGTHIRNVVLPSARMVPDHQFFLYYDPRDSFERDPAFHWVEEPAAKYSIREHLSLAKKAKKNRIDLFHAPHYTLPFFLNTPSIVTIHDLIHLKFPHYFPAWKVQAAKYVIRNAAKKSRSIITVSETTRTDLLNWMPFLEPKVNVIYNRLTEDCFQQDSSIDLRSLGIANEFILYVGNFKKHKGIDTLIDAYRRDSGLPSLVLVGSGHNMDHDLSKEILNMRNVRMFGFAGSQILRALYSRALLFVFPSRYEGFGYPPLEAMAAGCPVLSSDAPAMKEVLGNAAEFFECGNAEDLLVKLKSLLMQESRRKMYSDSGALQARRFSSDESSRKIVRLWG
ncbi:MAG TPA: glycosyltransferase family 1 protein [Anaerolineales bacterium]|nr:glycosyltransferase family 1 protein [Anaerolineales bacterium]